MPNYQNYLEKKGYSIKTIQTYQHSRKKFELWTAGYGTTLETIDYKGFIVYLGTLNKSGISKKTIQSYIGNLKHYFDYLQQENYRSDNPIENLTIKGIPKTVLKNVLEFEELEDLYYSYEAENGNDLRKRNKIILGLLIYQGLKTAEIYRLELDNIDLNKGKIEVLGSRISNGRIVTLKAWQFLEIQEYINEIRPRILHKKNRNTDQFFLNSKGKLCLKNSLKKVSDELKTYNQNYQDLNQIRSSVIVNWLKTNNLRKTQYLAGHRYISSTERYKQDNLESLQEMITSFHPLK
jgi:site-specific recombinase XerD